MDRFFDNSISTPMQTIVANSLHPAGDRDPYGVAEVLSAERGE
jgi:glutathione S-transferase